MDDVFISYSRKDINFVRSLADVLEKSDRQPWVDWQDIPPSAKWREEIFQGIDSTCIFIFIISPDSLFSKVCLEEVSHALERNKKIIPVIYRSVPIKQIPLEIQSLNFLYFRDTDDFEQSFSKLIETIETDFDWVRMHTHLLRLAAKWDVDREKSLLLRGRELQDARDWLTNEQNKKPSAGPLHIRFITQSTKEENSYQRKRITWISLALFITIALGLLSFILYRTSQSRLKVSTSRQLAAMAINEMEHNLDTGLLLSLESYNSAPTVESLDAILTGLLRYPYVKCFLQGGQGSTYEVVYNPKYGLVAASDSNGRIMIWDYQSTQLSGSPIQAHNGLILTLTFSPDGELLASGGNDGKIIFWDVKSRTPLGASISIPGEKVRCVSFNRTGTILAVSNGNGDLSLWDVESRQMIKTVLHGHRNFITEMVFLPGDKILVTASMDSDIRFWSIKQHRQSIEPLSGHSKRILGLAFADNDYKLISAGFDRKVIIWDPITREMNEAFQDKVNERVHALALSPDEKTLVTGFRDGSILRWQWFGGAGLPFEFPHKAHHGQLRELTFGPSASTLISVGADNKIISWDFTRQWTICDKRSGNSVKLEDVAFHPAGNLFATLSVQGDIILWELDDKKNKRHISTRECGIAHDLTFHPDGKWLLLASGNGLWGFDISDIKNISHSQLMGKGRPVHKIEISNDGSMLVLGYENGLIQFLDGENYKPLNSPVSGHKGTVMGLAFDPDGDSLISVDNEHELLLWDCRAFGPPVNPLKGSAISGEDIVIGADSRTLIIKGIYSLSLWDLETGEQSKSLLKGDESRVFGLALHPGGEILAAGYEDGSVVLWNIPTQQMIGPPLKGHQGFVWSLAFSPDGEKLVSTGDDGLIVWDTSVDSWREKARKMANRNLSRDEWRRFIFNRPYRKMWENFPHYPPPATKPGSK